MAVDVGGITHHPYAPQTVVQEVEQGGVTVLVPLFGETFEVFKADQVTPMVPLDPDTKDPLPLVVPATASVVPAMLLPELSGWVRVGTGDLTPIFSEDIGAIVAQVATLVSQNAELVAANTLLVERAEEAAVDARQARTDVTEFITSGGGPGGGGSGNDYGDFPDLAAAHAAVPPPGPGEVGGLFTVGAT